MPWNCALLWIQSVNLLHFNGTHFSLMKNCTIGSFYLLLRNLRIWNSLLFTLIWNYYLASDDLHAGYIAYMFKVENSKKLIPKSLWPYLSLTHTHSLLFLLLSLFSFFLSLNAPLQLIFVDFKVACISSLLIKSLFFEYSWRLFQ